MPLLWRYLLKQFTKVFALCLVSFVAILLITRSQDIAKFATINSGLKPIMLFALFQIPYILPLAIPISCLISSMILFQNLSHSQELTSMRASGVSIKLLLAPILMLTTLLALANLCIASELAPKCRILSKKALFQTAQENPLILLQKDKMLKVKDSFVDMEMIRAPHLAGNVVFAFRNPSTERINLIMAKRLALRENFFHGKDVALITTADAIDEPLDHLIIENQKEARAETSLISNLLQTNSMDLGSEFFPLKQMVIKGRLEKGKAQVAIYFEIFRRLFFLIIPFTLVYIGAVYGIQIGRRERKQNILYAVLLTVFAFASYFAAKSFESNPLFALLFFLLPHPVVFAIAGYKNWKLVRGYE